ncbi:hypothetical protein NC651_024683 [Populus alba x Populus x berolinensis]|nr:hypothetical protein NC651_024683 [Populus alba x Populus x berolinensis]
MSGNLVNYLADFFAKFVQSDKQLFDHLCQVDLHIVAHAFEFGTGSAGCYTNIFTIVSCVFGVRRIGSYSVPREGEQLPMRPCFDHPRTVIRDSEREMASPFQPPCIPFIGGCDRTELERQYFCSALIKDHCSPWSKTSSAKWASRLPEVKQSV